MAIRARGASGVDSQRMREEHSAGPDSGGKRNAGAIFLGRQYPGSDWRNYVGRLQPTCMPNRGARGALLIGGFRAVARLHVSAASILKCGARAVATRLGPCRRSGGSAERGGLMRMPASVAMRQLQSAMTAPGSDPFLTQVPTGCCWRLILTLDENSIRPLGFPTSKQDGAQVADLRPLLGCGEHLRAGRPQVAWPVSSSTLEHQPATPGVRHHTRVANDYRRG